MNTKDRDVFKFICLAGAAMSFFYALVIYLTEF